MHFVYHPHHEPVIVSPEEYQHYLCNGWYDTPAKFPKTTLAEKEEPPKDLLEEVPKKKGRPPKAKAEEVPASVEL